MTVQNQGGVRPTRLVDLCHDASRLDSQRSFSEKASQILQRNAVEPWQRFTSRAEIRPTIPST